MAGSTGSYVLQMLVDATRGNAAMSGFAQNAVDVAGTVGAAWGGLQVGQFISEGLGKGVELESAASLLEAQLGTVGDRAGEAGEVAGEMWRSGFVENIADANEAVRAVAQNIGDVDELGADAFSTAAGQAQVLADVMGEDVQGVTAAVSSMLKSGVAANAQEAFDVLAAGYQDGANKGEDMLDTFTEYSSVFGRLGLDGSEAMGLINQGLEAGARNSDLVADALKEFAIIAQEAMSNPVDPAAIEAAQDRVAQAYDNGAEAARNARDAARESAEAARADVVSAEAAVAAAQRDSLAAQEDVNQARRDAREALVEMADQLASAALGEKGAEIAVQRAQERLAEIMADGASTPLDMREAMLRVEQAQAGLSTQQKRVKDLKAEKAEADRVGVNGSDQVRAAQERAAQADRDVVTASGQLTEARAAERTSAIEGQRAVREAAVQAQADIAAATQALSDAMAPQLTTIGAAYAKLGLDGEAIGTAVAGGGDGATAALAQVLEKLRAVEDPTQRAQLAVSLFGTKAEDLQESLFALDPTVLAGKMLRTKDAMDSMTGPMQSGARVDMLAMQAQIDELEAKLLDIPGADMLYTWGPAISGITAALGPLLMMMVSLQIAQVTGTATGAGFAASLWATTWPILAIIAAVALLAAGVYLIFKNWDTIGPWFADLWDGIADGFGDAGDWIGDRLDGMLDWFRALPGEIGDALMGLVSILTWPHRTALRIILGTFRSVRDGVSDARDWVVDRIGSMVDWITSIPDQIGDLAGNIGEILRGTLHAIASGIAWLWNNSVGALGFSVPGWVPLVGGNSFSVPDITVPALAAGGVALGPTLALIGEAGPEAVVPLDRADGFGGGDVYVTVEIDGREVTRAVKRRDTIDSF